MSEKQQSGAPKRKKNTLGGDRPRNENDFYPTPRPLADAICRRLHATIGDVTHIVEPSAGGGPFVAASRLFWPAAAIVAVEPNEIARPVLSAAGADTVASCRWEAFPFALTTGPTLIVGNPPFDLPEDSEIRNKLPLAKRGEIPVTAERHVRLSLERLGDDEVNGPQSRWLAFILRQSFVATPLRYARLFSKRNLRYRWPIVGRPSFTGDGASDNAEYEVFVWQAGYRGLAESEHLVWKPESVR